MGTNEPGQHDNEKIEFTELDEFFIRLLCKEIFGPDHELSDETLKELRNIGKGEV